MENECIYSSSVGIRKSCNMYSLNDCLYELSDYNFYLLNDNDILYIKIDFLPIFINNINTLTKKIILVSGCSDYTVPNSLFSEEEFLKLVENKNILHLFIQNCVYKHSKITILPIGLDYHTLNKPHLQPHLQTHLWGSYCSPLDQENDIQKIADKSKKFWERDIDTNKLCYSNFHFSINSQDRIDAITKLQSINNLIYYEPRPIIRIKTWENQCNYPFVLSPHGNGLDCHRTWESLILGSIPIVKTSHLDSLYDDLPVLIIEDWSLLTKELLINTINVFKQKVFNYEKLTLKYWINEFNKYKQDIHNDTDKINGGCGVDGGGGDGGGGDGGGGGGGDGVDGVDGGDGGGGGGGDGVDGVDGGGGGVDGGGGGVYWGNEDLDGFNKCIQQSVGQITLENLVGKYIFDIASNNNYKTYLEIGTWNGLGSTKCFIYGFKNRVNKDNYKFYSLECNKHKYEFAKELYKDEKNVFILNEVLLNDKPDDIYTIFPEITKSKDYMYWNDIDFLNMKDKKLFFDDSKPQFYDVILLDGGEFTTWYEYNIIKNKCKILILDDTNTLKCKKVKEDILISGKWNIILESNERNGILVAERKKIKLFNLDLHISVIADIKNIINTLYNVDTVDSVEPIGPVVEIVNYSLSSHNWVFGNYSIPNIEIITPNTWQNIDANMINSFVNKYYDFLSTFDGFIVTHTPIFALLYEKFNKPIILVNSCRYEQPYSWRYDCVEWEWANIKLKELYDKKLLIAISNNKGDSEYLKLGTGIESIIIPSLCLYTQCTFAEGGDNINKKDNFIIYSDDNFNAVKKHISPINPNIYIKGDCLHVGYKWKELYSYKGIIHFPYEISTMSIFEQYSANVPLIFPTKNFLKKLINIPGYIFNSRYNHLYNFNCPYPPNLDKCLNDDTWINFWLDNADYYNENMKYITYFDSIDELNEIVTNIDVNDISLKMKKYNELRTLNILQQWKKIIDTTLAPQLL
jgi:hypothetical protein